MRPTGTGLGFTRRGKRLLRVGDFLRVTGAGQDRLAELLAVATVHSGRRGIAPDVTPAGVLAILGPDELPPAWLSPPSGANYAVIMVEETARRIGVVHIGQAVGDGRVWGWIDLMVHEITLLLTRWLKGAVLVW